MRSTNRGAGLFIVIVVLLILILLVMALQQAFFSGTVLDDAAAEHTGLVALTAAESAIEEQQLAVRRGVNDPASPLYKLFRQAIGAGVNPGFELPKPPLESARALIAKEHAGLEIDDEPPRVTHRQPLDEPAELGYGEHWGTLAYRVTVRAKNRARVSRTLTAHQEFKVVVANMPPPYDQVCLFLARPVPLVADANRAADYFGQVRQQWLDQIDQLRKATPAGAKDLDQLRAAFEDIRRFEKGRPIEQYSNQVVHEIPGDLLSFVNPGHARFAKQVTGPEVDLSGKLPQLLERVKRLYEGSRTKLKVAVKPGASDADLTAFLEALPPLINETRDAQGAIFRWQEMMGELTGAQANLRRLELRRLDADVLRRKAFFTVTEQPGEDATQAFDRLRREIRERTGTDRLSGIISVQNPRTELDLTGKKFEGRLVISATGSVRVGGTERAGGGDHIAVVAHGKLVVDGDVRGFLAATKDYEILRPATITGGLVLAKPAAGTLANLTIAPDPAAIIATISAGTVQYDPKFYQVGIAPELAGQGVRRDRASPRP